MEREKNLYMYVYRMLLTSIYNGTYEYQAKLPTLPTLCEQYKVGRNTIRMALKKLEEDGYILQQQGTKAVVSFNIYDLNTNLCYRQALRDAMAMSKDVYETIELVFPNMNISCFEQSKPEDIQTLYDLLNRFNPTYIHTETELVNAMNMIYLYIIRLSKNPIMEDLGKTLLSHAYQPVVLEEQSFENIKRSTRGIRKMVLIILNFAMKKQKLLVKQSISLTCRLHKKSSMRRFNALCKGLDVKQEVQFVWVCNRNQEWLYMSVALDIMSDIVYGYYQIKESLPSISTLATKYDVSQRTIRSTLEVLRQYKVIETTNGIGSRIILESFDARDDILKRDDLQQSLRAYESTLQLFTIMLEAIQYSILKKAKVSELREVAKNIEAMHFQTLAPLSEYIFKNTNACLYTIFKELLKTMKWKSFCSLLLNEESQQITHLRNELIRFLKAGDVQAICKTSLQILELDRIQLQTMVVRKEENASLIK